MSSGEYIRVKQRYIAEKLTEGWTLSDFAKHFKLDDAKFEEIVKRFKNAETYLDQMRSNPGRRQKPTKVPQSQDSSATTSETIESGENDMKAILLNQSQDSIEAKSEATATSEAATSTLTLEELISLEGKLASQMRSLELSQKETSKMLVAKQNEANQISDEIRELRKKVHDLKSMFKNTLEDMDRIHEDLVGISTDISTLSHDLSTVREEIGARTTIQVLVYSNFEISVVSEVDIVDVDEVDDEEANALFTNLIYNKSLQDFTVSQIRALSRSLLHCKSIIRSGKGKKLVFTFDTENETISTLFESLKQNADI